MKHASETEVNVFERIIIYALSYQIQMKQESILVCKCRVRVRPRVRMHLMHAMNTQLLQRYESTIEERTIISAMTGSRWQRNVDVKSFTQTLAVLVDHASISITQSTQRVILNFIDNEFNYLLGSSCFDE